MKTSLKEAHPARVFDTIEPMKDAQRAFTTAYEENADALFRHCYFRISNRERAIELVQEACMKTWDQVVQGKQIENHRAFLYRVLNNLIIDEYRKKKSTSLDALLEKDSVSEGHFEELYEGGVDDAAARIDVAFQVEDLRVALGKLPDNYRRVVVMRFIDELRPQEIAEALGESENAVSVRINRGVKKLQQLLHDNHE